MRDRSLAIRMLAQAARRLAPVIGVAIATLLVLPALGPLVEPRPALAQDGSRLFVATGSNGVDGQLFTVDPATAASTLIGNIRVGTSPIGITGLAVHPSTGVLYGSTANLSPNHAGTLVTINRTTGAATVIGSFNAPGNTCSGTMQDIAFRVDGTLFGFCQSTLFRINLSTGAATVVGSATFTGGSGAGGRGLTFRPPDSATQELWGAPRFIDGPIFRIDPATGAILQTLQMSGGSADITFAALTTDRSGTLLGMESEGGFPSLTRLAAINTTTGAITFRGSLPDDSDAIALDFFGFSVVTPVGTSGGTSAATQPEDDTDKPRKETDEQRQQRQRTNRAGEDEYRIEGQVVAVACEGRTPTVTIANRDGQVAVQLIKGAEKLCSSVRVGDYLFGEGYKEHEALFMAWDISTERR